MFIERNGTDTLSYDNGLETGRPLGGQAYYDNHSLRLELVISSTAVTPTTPKRRNINFRYSLQLQITVVLYCIMSEVLLGKINQKCAQPHGKSSMVQWHGMKL